MANDSTVRCPTCRGSKQVVKLGGIFGECGKCEGKGTVKESSLCSPSTTNIDAIFGAAFKPNETKSVIAATAKIAKGEPTPVVKLEDSVSKNGRTIYKRASK